MSAAGLDRVIAIVGPTASGKSRLAIQMAESVGGEIIGADSRQIYRHMDIGTAKPSLEDRQRVRHHLIDIIDPSEEYSVALYVRQAREAISDILNRGGVPIVVGGTGQYVWALLEGWNVPEASPDHALREQLNDRLSRDGLAGLVEELRRVAPATAQRVDLANPRRVVRALELAYRTTEGEPEAPTRTSPPFQATAVGIAMDRSELYARINARVDAMFEAGWVGEVRKLREMGFGPELPSMSSLGYREISEYLSGERTRDDAIDAIKGKTRRFARQQGNWFRAGDERIRWFPNEAGSVEEAVRYVSPTERVFPKSVNPVRGERVEP